MGFGSASAKERCLRTPDPELFRLSFLLDPRFVLRRLRATTSLPDLARRAGDVGLYAAYGLQNGLYRARGILMDIGRPWCRRLKARWTQATTAGNFFVCSFLVDLRTGSAVARFRARAALGRLRPRESVANPECPLDRRPPLRLHVSWNPHIACNYDCVYCWFHGDWKRYVRANLYISPEKWATHWSRFNARFGPARIDFAGGEPFTYPGFLEILRAVSMENVCMISTNLFWDEGRAIGALDPDRVGFYASFHPEFVRDAGEFREKVMRLRRAGFYASVSIVAYPSFMPMIPDWIDFFMARGIYLSVQPFRGDWAGLPFPGSYSRSARRLLVEFMEGGHHRRYYPSILQPPPRQDHADPALVIRKHLLFDAPTLGVPCNAGATYFRLFHNGDVVRCSQGGLIGNFLDEDFELLEEAEPCPFERCTCPSEIVYIRGGPKGPSATRRNRGGGSPPKAVGRRPAGPPGEAVPVPAAGTEEARVGL